MRRFRPVLEILARYRTALFIGFACILFTQAANMSMPLFIQRAFDATNAPGAGAPSRPHLAIPLFIQGAFDALCPPGGSPERLVLLLAAGLVGVAAVRGLFQYWMRWLLMGVSRRLETDLRQRVFEHLTRLHFGWFDRARTGDILSRLTADVDAVRMATGPGTMYLVNTLIAVPLALTFMWGYSPRLTLLVLVPMALTAIATKVLSPAVHRASMRMQEGQADLASRAQESFAGVRVVKSYGREEAETAAFREQGLLYSARVMDHVRARMPMIASFFLFEGAGMLVILYVGGGMVGRGEMTLGQFAAFNFFNLLLLWPMIALGWVVTLFQRGAAAMDRINEILDTRPDVDDAPGLEPLPSPRGEIEIRNLTFAYGANPPVLHDVSLKVPAGRCLAVIGPTGSGKSTLLSLVPRLYRAPAGTVLLDGIPVERIRLADLRRAIGVVPQETFLFSTSIRENIAWGFEDGAPEGVVESAARASRIADEILRFPSGYDTLLGERGVNLSGGQKQRTAIARALALEPRLLLLDDCLSSVDAHTEEEILRNLREAIRGRTTVMVSHRVAAVRHADEIVFLEGGRIVERGTHEQLLALGGPYAALARLQALRGEIESAA